jgi:hypothetical protein
MKVLKNSILLFIVSLLSCSTHSNEKQSLFTKDTTNSREKNNSLFVFVGEKVDVQSLPNKPGDFDEGVKARYKILKRVYGDYPNDTVEFEAYDHYGTPEFSKYKTVLLFIRQVKGKYYQEKYMFNDVYMTKTGNWAGSYDAGDYGHEFNKNTKVKPEKISFVEEVSYELNLKEQDSSDINRWYPDPYFRIANNKAIAVYGNYIEDLFKLKRDGYLTARELFGTRTEGIHIQDVELIEHSTDTTSK